MTAVQIFLWSLVALPFVLFVLILAVVIYGSFFSRRMVARAAASLCPKCETIIGKKEILAAKERFRKKIVEMRKQNPGIKFRFIAEWEIHCSNCDLIFYFYPSTDQFETVSFFAKKA